MTGDGDEWEMIGNAELEVMACLDEWGELLCHVWKLEREISGRNVARWIDISLGLCHYMEWVKSLARVFFDIIGGLK